MIYLISAIESFCTGLTGINFVLYLKFILGLNEIQSGWFISIFGILSAVSILLFGPLIDKIGLKKSAIIGSAILALSRIALGFNVGLNLSVAMFVVGLIGSAIKSSSITVYLKQNNKSFKADYVVLNIAYFFAGIMFDELRDYKVVYLIAGILTLLNIVMFTKISFKTIEKVVAPFNWSIFRQVLTYNSAILPVSSMFVWMNSGLPKWVLQVLGPDAPVGKIYGSLNPAIIIFLVPLVAWSQAKLKKSPYSITILGSFISASSFLLMLLPFSNYINVLLTIIGFTIGESLWSPANFEVSAKLCPEGEEGTYMTVSLIPGMLSRLGMGWLISYSMVNFIYSEHKHYAAPFVLIGLLALVTPIILMLFKKYFQKDSFNGKIDV